ncbi:LacI family DNA-binding transcriptional regulator [[Flexibacter] sp. ATCC 35208]|uniref:LacI family DNA-binding transcriptional regulator n=1 Tax=[Flexibacter] sp. ATCC 35208 TaxID=1936242 RepID=UPI0009C581BD|nr:substrate-binding domain-containing protein [[Flexibacter] sp. ATCC 35208]OMP79350.1 LacI family transcriptional regulator [[Flexibacter] sp. ATCC 35208]
MKKLRIKDIADGLNISKTAVSFILNGKAEEKRISEELVERVEKYIQEVGYRPSPIARGLRTGKSHIIGLMVESISDPFFATIARLIENEAYKEGYRIIYCSTDNDTEKTKELINVLKDRSVDGYIISPPPGVEKEVNELIKAGMPVVMFDRYLPKVKTDYVVIDNEPSAENATNYLIKQGYSNIGFITFSSSLTQMKGRLKGYKNALKNEGLKSYVLEIDFTPEEKVMVQTVRNFLVANPKLDAILFGAIQAGSCGLKAMTQLKLKVPEDLAVISFDDHDIFELFATPVTAIAQPIEKIAHKVIGLLLDRLDPEKISAEPREVVLKTKMKVRGSSVVKNPKKYLESK